MQRLKNALRDRRGETIVEVLVAFVLLMLFLALFTASLRFARRASAQAQTTRDNAYLLTEAQTLPGQRRCGRVEKRIRHQDQDELQPR